VLTLSNDHEHFVFPNVAYQLFDKGAWKDAIVEANRLIRAHPKDGKRHATLAELLVQMGLGEAGRREARLAVQLQPNDADNHVILGWALSHDLFGRPYGPGHDHTGARAELEKARKLDPKHVGAALELGNLLARDERGHTWVRGADPKACAVARRAANELEPTAAHAEDLVRALLWAGDYAGAEKLARAAQQSDNRDAMLITAIALGAGVAAASRAADGLGSIDTRKRALTTAAGVLLAMRHYAEARAVYAELGIYGPTTAQGQVFAKLSVIDRPLDVKTPAGAMVEAELSVMRDEKPQGFWDVKTAEEVSREIERTIRVASKTAWLSGEVYGDIARSMTKGKVEGDKRAWRVELGFGGQVEVIYAAEERGAIKLIGVPTASYGVGRHALRLLANNDVEAARRLLDWVAKDAKHLPLFELVWGPNHANDRDAIELAAAVLSGPTDPDHALAIVEKCTAAPPKGDLACLATMDEINTARGALDDTIAQVVARLATHPKDPASSRVLAEAFALSGRAKEAEALLPDITAPFDGGLDRVRVKIAIAENDTPAAIKILEAATKVTGAPSYPFNELAWLEVTTPTRLQDAVAAATEAVRLDANTATLHTKAVAEEEVGDLRSALEDDHKAIELRSRNEPDGNDWYVLGRMAELVGLRDDAIAAYRRVTAPRTPNRFIVSSYTLAQRRLAALGKP
jgi:tetratricopeptide (TPR) repeat protein